MDRLTRTLIALELLLCVAAVCGGVQLAAVAPHDAMPADALARTPFSSWVWPGIFLIATVAVPAGAVAAGALARRAWSHVGHVAVGLLLVGWIAVQVAVIGSVSALQPVMAGWGLAIAALGAADYRRRPRVASTSLRDGP